MAAVARRLSEQYPTSNRGNGIAVNAYYEAIVRNIRPVLGMLLGAVGLLLLIACSNLTSLMLARAESRHRELAVRSALGASRVRLVRQVLMESTILAGADEEHGRDRDLTANEQAAHMNRPARRA